MGIRYAIFDLDQTLIRSKNQDSAWQTALGEFDLLHRFEDSWIGGAGRPLTASAKIVFGTEEDDPRHRQLIDRFWDHVGDGDPEPIDGADETLRQLVEMGITLFLSTGSYEKAVTHWLASNGWTEHFDLVLPSSETSPKGSEHYRLIIEHLGVPLSSFAAEAMTVGDGAFDMRYGVEHGVAYRIGYAPLAGVASDTEPELREAGANVIVRSLRELPRFVARVNRAGQ